MLKSYQKITGTLSANSHPGSYSGQDAYNDMLITGRNNANICTAEDGRIQGIGQGKNDCLQGLQERNRPNFEGGYEMDTAVRRLMPIECERLQGYPDNYTLIGEPEEGENGIDYIYYDSAGKRCKVSDSARYRSLGNSICLPFWQWLARRICAQYERDITMGSLFSGIGGFELVFQRCGAFPIWASEVDEFCIAVTKTHFPEAQDAQNEDFRNAMEEV